MVVINLEKLRAITPNALNVNREAFECADKALVPFGVLNNERRAAHFLAQVLHETDGLRLLVENLNYSAKRLTEVWPTRFPTLASARPYERNPRALANKVYGGRMGNTGPDDGWRYIGRGLLQITGKNMYQVVGEALEVDLVDNPNLVITPELALPVAGQIWRLKGCNVSADLDSVEGVTKRINGGTIGLASRRAWLTKTRGIVEMKA